MKLYGGERGIVRNHPGFCPAGALRATKFAPGEFVEPDRFAIGVLSLDPGQNKRPPIGGLLFWLGERDSNPRWRSQSPQSYH